MSPAGGRVSEIMDIRFDQQRDLLWVLVQVPGDEPDWAEGLISERGEGGRMYYGPAVLDKVYDSVIEAIRVSKGEVVVSLRVKHALRRFLGGDRVASHVTADSDGIEYIVIWRILGIPRDTGGFHDTVPCSSRPCAPRASVSSTVATAPASGRPTRTQSMRRTGTSTAQVYPGGWVPVNHGPQPSVAGPLMVQISLVPLRRRVAPERQTDEHRIFAVPCDTPTIPRIGWEPLLLLGNGESKESPPRTLSLDRLTRLSSLLRLTLPPLALHGIDAQRSHERHRARRESLEQYDPARGQEHHYLAC